MTTKVHFVATPVPEAQAALTNLRQQYEDTGPDNADVIVALGGDGFMLQTLHAFVGSNKPIYGMNLGTVGFLMNEYNEADLTDRLAKAEPAKLHPLRMRATTLERCVDALAFNEVSMLRQTRQATKLRILVDGKILYQRTDLRWGTRRDTRRQHCLQPIRAWTDHTNRCGSSGADTDQRFPAAALARSPPSAPCQGPI